MPSFLINLSLIDLLLLSQGVYHAIVPSQLSMFPYLFPLLQDGDRQCLLNPGFSSKMMSEYRATTEANHDRCTM